MGNNPVATGTNGRTHNGRYTHLDQDKLRGGYYTSSEVTDWLCSWAIRSPKEKVLEPSCGDGSFIESVVKRLLSLGSTPSTVIKQLRGIEILESEALKSRNRIESVLGDKASSCIEIYDFFQWWKNSSRDFDCVVGNPPFIRYQSFPEPSRSLAMSIMQDSGLTPNRLTNIWVPFVVASMECLKPDGRMAFVLPAELLQVTYASQLRSLLVDRFKRIDIIACNDLFFTGAEQEVVLFLAEGAHIEASSTNTCRVALTEAKKVKDILHGKPSTVLRKASPKIVQHDNEKWLKYFLSPEEIDLMRRLREESRVVPLREHASIDVGVVTGKNSFFVLAKEQIIEFGLENYVEPLIGRSAHLKGAQVTKNDWRNLSEQGEQVHLFYVNSREGGSLSESGRKYVDLGEKMDFHKGYKCSIRTPWYSVPSVWEPDCFFFRQIYDFPRVVLNHAGATSTDTIHRMKCKSDAESVASCIYTYLTAASAEIEGRSYGGGVLELEPTEAERLLVPASTEGGLPIVESDRLIRNGRLDTVLEENDHLILRGKLGLSKQDCIMLRAIWEKMRNRRLARRRSKALY